MKAAQDLEDSDERGQAHGTDHGRHRAACQCADGVAEGIELRAQVDEARHEQHDDHEPVQWIPVLLRNPIAIFDVVTQGVMATDSRQPLHPRGIGHVHDGDESARPHPSPSRESLRVGLRGQPDDSVARKHGGRDREAKGYRPKVSPSEEMLNQGVLLGRSTAGSDASQHCGVDQEQKQEAQVDSQSDPDFGSELSGVGHLCCGAGRPCSALSLHAAPLG
mmetsp:Transcript_99075/g.284847  ORF Transcript_99075/g.284847 Transcript_99075/m.284847 type:complete len:220 (-) Transcript_99075:61-720(-)